jgi:phosphoenolpyruvate synthase/pyruvate phosphate dikinase
MQGLETEVQLAYQQLSGVQEWPRVRLLQLNRALLDCAYGSGLLSWGERASLTDALDFAGRDEIGLSEYRNAVGRLKRAPAWALGTIRHTFAEALMSYVALDERAARFGDDVLRGSPLWMLGDTLKILSLDVDRLAGSVVELAGHPVSTAVALNSGIARGRLRIFATNDEVAAAEIDRGDIVVLPETIAELSPVAGILTLGEGNALSHVQLLARNFGIPNVAVDLATIDKLQPLAGQQVVLVVGSGGNVVLQAYDDDIEQAMAQPVAVQSDERIRVPVPDLGVQEILHLADIGRELSGKLVGPKAANLGELNRLFPGKVAPAVAIPFGIYAAHLEQAGLMQRIEAAFAGRDAGSMSAEEAALELAAIRSAIAAIHLSPATTAALDTAMAKEFGAPGSYGVFVRSDTNVEDLPQFTGAGLNETIANVVGTELQRAGIPRVWSSVLSPRALAWRASVLANPAQIYASVLLMKSVSSTKSGVLVTSNLIDRSAPGLTASVAWGVGGAVAGEAAESIVILADSTELVFEAKSPYQRNLAESGGVELLPAKAGPVLQADEIQQLRVLAAEVNSKYASVPDDAGVARPWDIEFGFVDGALTLFQIRPLVEKTSRNADALLNRLRPGLASPPDNIAVRLDESPVEAIP